MDKCSLYSCILDLRKFSQRTFLLSIICCQKTDMKAPVVILDHVMILKIEVTPNE